MSGGDALRVDVYAVLARAVDEGIDYGWSRAHKHCAEPDEIAIKCAVYEAVMGAICEVFRFDGGDDA